MFQLVFRGECTPGTDPESARDNARNLFKATADQVAKMFSGQRVVIRNRLDEAQADKYRAVLKKHGMVAYVEPMPGEAVAQSQAAEPPRTQTAPAKAKAADATPEAGAGKVASTAVPVAVEPGERLRVAGDKVDDILASSALSLDPVGVTLAEREAVETPMFEHLDEWTLAPAGSSLAERSEAPPPVVPDVSHLSLADDETGRE